MTEDFDKAARTWDEKPRRLEIAKCSADEIALILGETDKEKALEFGCGTGTLSFELSEVFKSIYAVDSSCGMISVLQEKIEKCPKSNITPVCCDILQDDFKENGFSAIYTSMALHHIDDVGLLLNKLADILVTNGLFACIDLLEEDGSFHGEQEGIHHKGFSERRIDNIFEKAGFEKIIFKIIYRIEKEIAGGSVGDFPLFLAVGRKRK